MFNVSPWSTVPESPRTTGKMGFRFDINMRTCSIGLRGCAPIDRSTSRDRRKLGGRHSGRSPGRAHGQAHNAGGLESELRTLVDVRLRVGRARTRNRPAYRRVNSGAQVRQNVMNSHEIIKLRGAPADNKSDTNALWEIALQLALMNEKGREPEKLTFRYTRHDGFNQDTLEYFFRGELVDGGRIIDLEPGRIIRRLEQRGLSTETAVRIFHDAEELRRGCAHERLNEDGICRACGVDRRGH